MGSGIHAWLQPNGALGESNACLVVGDGASLLVDTLWDPRLTRRMLAAMAPLIADAPITTLVNTHSDADHWWGNQEVAAARDRRDRGSGRRDVRTDAEGDEALRSAGERTAACRGSVPIPYPRRDEVAVIAPYVSGALEAFAFDEVRLVAAHAHVLR